MLPITATCRLYASHLPPWYPSEVEDLLRAKGRRLIFTILKASLTQSDAHASGRLIRQPGPPLPFRIGAGVEFPGGRAYLGLQRGYVSDAHPGGCHNPPGAAALTRGATGSDPGRS